MKKIILYIMIFITALCKLQPAYADDVATMPTTLFHAKADSRAQTSPPTLFTADTPKLDYSRLNGVLTVEVSGQDDASILLISEYTSDDRLIKAYIINDIKETHSITITGAYEKIFLWTLPDMIPQCESLSTKCDYEIIEGVDGEWEVSDDGHTLYNYIGDDTDVIIPNSYRGKRIYAVENTPEINEMKYNKVSDIYHYNIFNSRTDITSVQVPEGIKGIGRFAFSHCKLIAGDISLPESIQAVGGYAYYNCSSLTGSLNLSKLIRLDGYAFYGCSGLNGELTLPAIPKINMGAFAYCNNLIGNLNIPEGVVEIGQFAFTREHGGGFTALTLPSTLKRIGIAAFQYHSNISNELILPEGLEHIGDFAFNHCTRISNTVLNVPGSLKTIGGDYNVENNTGYGCHVFYDSFKKVTAFNADSEYFTSVDGVLYSADKTRLVAYPPGKSGTEFIIPEGVTQLDEMSFAHSKITDLTLPDSYIIQDVPKNVINNMANNLAVALYHNNSIQNVWTKPTNTRYASSDGIIYSADFTNLWYVPSKKTGTITILDGTENIQKGAFYIEYSSGGETYTGVHIPASVKHIAPENLKSINLRPLENITINEKNKYYTVIDGKISENNT